MATYMTFPPSLILYESDSSSLKTILKKRDYLSLLMKAFKNPTEMENAVVLKYIEHNPSCVVLPYEWEMQNQYYRKHKLRKKPGEMINSIIQLNNENLLTNNQSAIVNKFLELNGKLNKIGKKGTLTDINSLISDNIVKQRQDYI